MPLGKRKPPGWGRLSGGDVSADGFDTPDISLQTHPRKRAAGPHALCPGERAGAALQDGLRDHRLESQLQLVREHWTSVRRLWLDGTDAARIRSDLPDNFLLGCGMPGFASINPTDDGRFEFTEGSLTALVIPAYDTIPGMLDANPERHVEHLIDLIAVDVDQPNRFWRRRGAALVLGNAFLEIAGQERERAAIQEFDGDRE